MYHVMLRGINRQMIFEDDQDRWRFLETLKRYKSVSDYQIFSYCLMDNHVHLLMKEQGESISNAIKRIGSSYVYWYNRKYDRSGHLFQDRYKSETIESAASFLRVLRYIHQNPVKAGLESDVFACKWTSMHEYIHHADMIDIDFGLNLFSSNRKKAIQLYGRYMQQANDDKFLEDTVKLRISDQEVLAYIAELGIPKMSTLQQMERKHRNAILARLKTIDGISQRQLARITGISKSVIQRAR